MGLDVTVHCDCFERGRCRPAPPEWGIHVGDDGIRTTGPIDDDTFNEFVAWDLDACEHPRGVLLHHRIGNIGAVGVVRFHLSQHPELVPIILAKVVYNGSHCGDFLTPDEIRALVPEVARLAEIHAGEDDEWLLRRFEQQMHELIATALAVGKPIAF